MPCFFAVGTNSSAAKTGRSAINTASTPASTQRLKNTSWVGTNTKLAQSNKPIGISGYFARTLVISSKHASVLKPPSKARLLAAWITGPSSKGSENGKPSSKAFAPFSTRVSIISNERSKSGSQSVTNVTKAPSFLAFNFAKRVSKRLIMRLLHLKFYRP